MNLTQVVRQFQKQEFLAFIAEYLSYIYYNKYYGINSSAKCARILVYCSQ